MRLHFKPLGRTIGALLVVAGGMVPYVRAAETSGLAELAQLLGKVEADSSADISSGLQQHLVHFRDIDVRRQREFAAASARELPARAAQKLADAKTAYAAGHGRLLTILEQLANGASPTATATTPRPDRASLAHEAIEIVHKLQNASGGVPISQSLSVTSPTLAAPGLNQPLGGSQSADAIGPVPAWIKATADALADPIAVYDGVRNTIKPEFYYGVMKGPVQALAEGSANDADTASLLMYMLRAKGIPARFVRGTVEVSADVLMQITGTGTVEQAVRVLERAGIPHEIVLGGTGVSSVKMERVWVEAYMPSANYRGVLLDNQGQVWVPLDAAFKPLSLQKGRDLARDLAFDTRAAVDDYLTAPRTQTALDFVRDRVSAAAASVGTTYDAVLSRRTVVPRSLGILPNTFPYKIVNVTETSYDLPDALRHTVRVRAEAITGPVIDTTVNVADVLGRRLTLAYVPFSQEDADLAASYGGLSKTPPYLVEVKAVLRSGGIEIAAGSGPIGMGVRFTLHIELGSPGGTQVVEQQVTAGNLTVIGLGGSKITEEETEQNQAAEILSRLAWRYLDKWNASDEEIANLTHVVPVRPTVSLCLVMSAIDVQYAGGDPQYPLTFDWKGIAIDAHRRASAPAGMFTSDSERSFLLLSGLEGSVLEERLFEDELQIDSVSTTRVLGMAHQQGQTVYTLDGSNVDQTLATLPFDPQVLNEVRDAALRGYQVTIPAGNVTELAWTGVGYRILDDRTGEAAYQLQGGYSGGMTAPSALTLLVGPGAILQGQGETVKESPENSRVAHVDAFPADDFQFGTVNMPLANPLRVRVMDGKGHPVSRASVTFTAYGGGYFTDRANGTSLGPQATAYSDANGIASATLALGKLTSAIPRYFQGANDEFATQVGMNEVTASVGNVVTPQPFTAVAFPDYEVEHGRDADPTSWIVHLTLRSWTSVPFPNLTVPTLLWVDVKDQWENPISNKPIRFSQRSVAVDDVQPDYPGYSVMSTPTTTPGHVLTLSQFLKCQSDNVSVRYGECEGEAEVQLIKSGTNGAYAYPLLGDSPFSHYDYDVGTVLRPQLFLAQFHTAGLLCPRPDPTVCSLGNDAGGNPMYRPGTFALAGSRFIGGVGRGPVAEAYKVNGQADMTFWTDMVWEEAKLVPVPDKPGHCWAAGAGKWHRRRLGASDITLTRKTPGTGTPPTADETAPESGIYRAVMGIAATPQLNTVQYDVAATPPVIPRSSSSAKEADPSICGGGDQNWPDGVKRISDPTQVWRWEGTFNAWGIKPTVSLVSSFLSPGATPSSPAAPNGILLDVNGRVARTGAAQFEIQPPEFNSLLTSTDVRFELLKDGQSAITGNDTKEVTIPESMRLDAGTYQARVSVVAVSSDGKDVISDMPEVPVGPILLALDSNNDTLVDDKDDEAIKNDPTLKFGFWEADPILNGKDALVDWATLRIKLPFDLVAGTRVIVKLPDSSWALRRKEPSDAVACPPEAGEDVRASDSRAYLCNTPQAVRQTASFGSNVGQPGYHSVDSFEISSDNLHKGDNDFLFQCVTRVSDGTRSCPASEMILSLFDPTAGSVAEVEKAISRRNVDIWPLKHWASIYTARRGTTKTVRMPLLRKPDWADWQALPSAQSPKHFTILIHGFVVGVTEAETVFLPNYFKRLYWAGRPMMSVQSDDATGHAHTIFVEWPGDLGDTEYNIAEFNAFQSGVALAQLLSSIRAAVPDATIDVMAHSLGNMVANQAIARAPSHTVNTYVMHESIVSASAFDSSLYPIDEGLIKHAAQFGEGQLYAIAPQEAAALGAGPSDKMWADEWQQMQSGQPTCLTCSPDYTDRDSWNDKMNVLWDTHQVPLPKYEVRWNQSRPTGGIPDSVNASVGRNAMPERGSWTGYFEGNLAKARIVNSFNTHDGLLTVVWYENQLKQRPYNLSLEVSLIASDRESQFWADLRDTGNETEALWGGVSSHANLIRQWAELSYWFPSLTEAAGAGAQPHLDNIDLSFYGNFVDLTMSHSFMRMRPYDEVWSGWHTIKTRFDAH
jgi:transglutaminase-like putative cysteine protease